MYNNVGKKIKGWASINCVLGIIFSLIVAIYIFKVNDSGLFKVIALFVLLVGSFLSWLGSLCLYAYGELVDKVTSIHRGLGFDKPHAYDPRNATEWRCSCGKVNPYFVAVCSCGKSRDNSTEGGGSIKCPDCGAIERADHKFCYHCGCKLH